MIAASEQEVAKPDDRNAAYITSMAW